MLRRLETMVLMTGYELPLRAIREQIASAVDLIVHTARLKDGSRKVVNITEVYGIEDDEILTQDIFAFEQTGVDDGKIEGELKPTGIRPTFMGQFAAQRRRRCRRASSASRRRTRRSRPASMKGRFGLRTATSVDPDALLAARLGQGGRRPAAWSTSRRSVRSTPRRARSSSGGDQGPDPPVPDEPQGRRSRRRAARSRRSSGRTGRCRTRPTSTIFNEEWVRWFPGDAPVGQGTLMPPLQRRAGFRISIGVIAQG